MLVDKKPPAHSHKLQKTPGVESKNIHGGAYFW